MENQFKIAADVFIHYKGKLLLNQRGPQSHGSGTWALIGGHVNLGEFAIEGIIREVNEELGLSLAADRFQFVRILDRAHAPNHYINVHFRLELNDSEISQLGTVDEHSQVIFKQEVINREPGKSMNLKLFELSEIDPETLFPAHSKSIAAEINHTREGYITSTK